MATNESPPEEKRRQDGGGQPDEPIQLLLERYAELELAHQLVFLRAAMPGALERLSPEERADFIRSIEPTGLLQ